MNASAQDIDSGTGEVVTPGEPVDHVDMLDGQSAGHGIEPPADPGDTVSVKPGELSRDEIYNKAKDTRDIQDQVDAEERTAEQQAHVERMQAEAAGVDPDNDTDPFDGEGNLKQGWVDTGAAPERVDRPPEPIQQAAEIPPEPVDSKDETVTITVYGMQQDVPKAEVDAVGGIANYQKIVAADEKMKRASTYEASVRKLDQEVSERLTALQTLQANPPATAQTGNPDLPPTGDQGETIDVHDAAEKLVGAMYTGDREAAIEEAATVLASFKSDVTRAAQTQVVSQPGMQGASRAEQQAEQQRAAAAEQERADANHVFVTEFKDLGSPVLRDATYNMVQKVAAEPIMYGRPLAEITREAGMRVRADVFGDQPPPAPKPEPPAPAQDLAGRMALKSRTVVQPLIPAAGRHADTPANERKQESNSEYISRMRRESRGQP
jgi:hypothetical protein